MSFMNLLATESLAIDVKNYIIYTKLLEMDRGYRFSPNLSFVANQITSQHNHRNYMTTGLGFFPNSDLRDVTFHTMKLLQEDDMRKMIVDTKEKEADVVDNAEVIVKKSAK
ncbi:hypothetical protein Tco_1324969 [Tanacetum coccineum]